MFSSREGIIASEHEQVSKREGLYGVNRIKDRIKERIKDTCMILNVYYVQAICMLQHAGCHDAIAGGLGSQEQQLDATMLQLEDSLSQETTAGFHDIIAEGLFASQETTETDLALHLEMVNVNEIVDLD